MTTPQDNKGYDPEAQLKKINEQSEKQQQKVAEVIAKTDEVMANFYPQEQAKKIEEDVENLMQSVNDELDKAMAEVNKQMNLIHESCQNIGQNAG